MGRNTGFKVAAAGTAIFALLSTALYLSPIGGVVYIAVHFIKKIW